MLSILLSSFSIFTAQAEVPLTAKVTSFVFAGRSTSAAELCGHIEGDVKSSQQILIVTDPKSKGPAKYIVATTAQGEFCALVATVFGQADVSVVGGGASSSAQAEANLTRE